MTCDPIIYPSSVMEHENNKGRFNCSINGLRGMCVMLVFIYHVYNAGLYPAHSGVPAIVLRVGGYVLSSFRYGVEMFFMISGYVILKSLRRHETLSSFLLDRVFRIFPAWLPVYLVLCCGGLLTGQRAFHDHAKWLIVVTNLVFLPPLIPLPGIHPASWSISYEWLFYGCAALLVAAQRIQARTLLWFGWLVVAIGLLTFPRALFFIPGVIAALREERGGGKRALARFPILSLTGFLLTWRATGIEGAGLEGRGYLLSSSRLALATMAVYCGYQFISSIAQSAGGISVLLSAKLCQRLGDVSYSFYIWHPVAMFAVKRFVISRATDVGSVKAVVLFASLSFAVAFPAAVLSRSLVEVRLTKWVKRGLARRVEHGRNSIDIAPSSGTVAGLSGNSPVRR